MIRLTAHLGAALLSVFLLSACTATAADKGSSPRDLIGSEWQLADLGGAGVAEGSTPTIAFPDPGKLIGDTGCNRFGGGCNITRTEMHVELLVSTKRACAEPLMKQEQTLLRSLEAAERWKLDGTTLLIYSKKLKKPMRFQRRR